ncbi:MAG: DnaJ domain-containing protein [Chloroflexi bacterium]|nr:DnaJ domain-containing protein [Chloroflexota bacterium]
MAHLGCASVGTSAAGFTGVWRVARFRVGRFEGARQRYDQRTEETQPETASTPLQKYYAALGVDADVERDALRKAYRLLARRYHPDVNKAPGATARMQQINEAYAALLALLADDGEARA